MDVDKETEGQIQELQILEQNLQGILMQKQAMEVELTEVKNALEEIKKSGEEIYKLIGQIMIRSKKEDIEKDLKENEKLLSIRIKSANEQEKKLSKISSELREKVLSKIQK